ncbi:sulfite oxidase-like oxidoreductase [Telluribacter sp.]|jgi:DMSO/TMAO reductase YedYZ molybdopterin-dependent catalytic subunit|uniref:sulfite oxidase-like oxidoreductase n=1 Tax=Telluribacter sp. TaxID=1978767 RepID=UPI002E15AFA8|nr:sulfite oxidase-like oxidoreductase [Telluribacter sp.]
MEEKDKIDRIIDARMKLKTRFEEKMKATPSVADNQPQGTGPANRHGMPKLPVGQYESKKWPVLDLGYQPSVSLDRWRLTINGEVEHPVVLKWDDFMALPQTEDTSDFHCVTTWSRFDMQWVGVKLMDLAALVLPKDTATHIMCYGYDTYTTNIALEEALKPDVLLVHTVDGEVLSREHGGPVRVITPQLYAWKGAKWIKRIQFLSENKAGFWEERGYSDTAYPWRNDRYDE